MSARRDALLVEIAEGLEDVMALVGRHSLDSQPDLGPRLRRLQRARERFEEKLTKGKERPTNGKKAKDKHP